MCDRCACVVRVHLYYAIGDQFHVVSRRESGHTCCVNNVNATTILNILMPYNVQRTAHSQRSSSDPLPHTL